MTAVLLFIFLTIKMFHISQGVQTVEDLVPCPENSYPFRKPTKIDECVGQEKRFLNGAVSTESTTCSQVGRDILENGGSAADAAVASMLCLGVDIYEAAGIGGGLFVLGYNRNREDIYAIDGREAASLQANKTMFKDYFTSLIGATSIGVPGALAALAKLHAKSGRLPWKELVEPSIKLCEDGVPMGFQMYATITDPGYSIHFTQRIRDLLFHPKTGKAKKEGSVIRYGNFCRTLRVIADDGPDSFYTGKLASQIVEDIKEEGGIIEESDLSTYEAKLREPVTMPLKDGMSFYSLPPPSGGALVAHILRILDGYNLTSHSASEEERVTTYHRFVEACKFAYARLTELADIDYENVTQAVHELCSPEYTDNIRSRIDDATTHPPEYYSQNEGRPLTPGTTHLAIVDKEGNSISITASINLHLGSFVIGSRTGIVFNDVMNDFSLPGIPNIYNRTYAPLNTIKPGKRPMSVMSPLMVLDKNRDVVVSGGSSGGSKIASTVSQVLMNLLYFKTSLKEAIDASRVHHQWIPNSLMLYPSEPYKKYFIQGLMDKGHNVENYCYVQPAFHGVAVQNGVKHAYTDPRKFGCPAGY